MAAGFALKVRTPIHAQWAQEFGNVCYVLLKMIGRAHV